MSDAIPIIFLKSENPVVNSYQEHFTTQSHDDMKFEPIFVPVLTHDFKEEALGKLRQILCHKNIGKEVDSEYGGLIFTSQRAVEAFGLLVKEAVEQVSGEFHGWTYLQDIPIYSVGPATTRALKAIPLVCPLNIRGTDSGNGRNLARFILNDYADWYRNWNLRRPLLFITGERHQSDISQILMNHKSGFEPISVVELEIYKTTITKSFKEEISDSLNSCKDEKLVWIVIFSPMSGEALLHALDILDTKTSKAKPSSSEQPRRFFFAAIGPTTRDFLRVNYDFFVDVCAEKPNAKSIRDGIIDFLKKTYQHT